MAFFKMKSVLVTLVILLFFQGLSQTIFATSDFNISKQTINPGSIYYPLKRLIEKILVNFQIDPKSKASFYENLVQTRLAELKYVAEKNYLDQVERSSQRVSYQVGILTDYLIAQELDDKKGQIVNLYGQDKVILEQLRDKYPANSSFWMLIQHVINSINLNLEKFENGN